MSDSFHGTPITPDGLLKGLCIGLLGPVIGLYCFCVSYWRPDQIALLARIARRVMIDNGAFSIWMANRRARERWIKGGRVGPEPESVVVDRAFRDGFLAFVRYWLPRCRPGSFFVPFDEIEAGSQVQNALLEEMPEGMRSYAWPVWHMNEPIERAIGLLIVYGRICVGSTDEFVVVGSPAWRARMDELFNRILADFGEIMPVHMLRGMQCQKDDFDYPFVSVDSTDLGRNHNRLRDFLNDVIRMTKQQLFKGRVDYWEQHNCPTAWPPLRLVHSRPTKPPPAAHPLLPHLPDPRKAA